MSSSATTLAVSSETIRKVTNNIGDGLNLMNIVVKNDKWKIRRVDTYIGIEGEGFSQVAHADDLDQPGVIFSYSSHVKT